MGDADGSGVGSGRKPTLGDGRLDTVGASDGEAEVDGALETVGSLEIDGCVTVPQTDISICV